MGKVLRNKTAYATLYATELNRFSDTTDLEAKPTESEQALQAALELLQEIIYENTRYKQDQATYLTKYNEQRKIVERKKQELETAKKAILEQTAKKEKLCRFLHALSLCNTKIESFPEEVFTLAIDKVLVKKDDQVTLVFCFTDGTEITEHIEDK